MSPATLRSDRMLGLKAPQHLIVCASFCVHTHAVCMLGIKAHHRLCIALCVLMFVPVILYLCVILHVYSCYLNVWHFKLHQRLNCTMLIKYNAHAYIFTLAQAQTFTPSGLVHREMCLHVPAVCGMVIIVAPSAAGS